MIYGENIFTRSTMARTQRKTRAEDCASILGGDGHLLDRLGDSGSSSSEGEGKLVDRRLDGRSGNDAIGLRVTVLNELLDRQTSSTSRCIP